MTCPVCKAVSKLGDVEREVWELVVGDPDEVPVKLAASLLDGVNYVDVERHLDPPENSDLH